jgi:4-hydroxy-3-polyprenylbenzoate decarboxylase
MTQPTKIVIAISGASGASLGLKASKLMPDCIKKHIILTDSAKIVLEEEEGVVVHDNSDISSSIASGSFGIDAMMITPCSMNSLAKISCGISDNLLTRSASVMIKENKKLLLAPREIPYSQIALENMHKLSKLGVVIAPANLGYYADVKTLDDMENFIIGKWFDLLGIKHNLYKRWQG